ncbi:MAG: MBL fold metallo-hydrolase [Calditrichia bacterium]
MTLKHKLSILLVFLLTLGCSAEQTPDPQKKMLPTSPYLVVLGIAQDAGYPQANCKKGCCESAWENSALRRHASCIALVDPRSGKRWLFEATPDIKNQLSMLDDWTETSSQNIVDGIFLTHAHIGHYTGLMHVGREVMGTTNLPVFAMPRMRNFLRTNGPWSQLVELQNVQLKNLRADSTIQLEKDLSVTPVQVPHRDEFSETVGFIIRSEQRSALFLPDIDKWEKWQRNIEDILRTVDVAYVDATFYANGEIPGRDMALIPHPFVEESMKRFAILPDDEKEKIHFIHLNHTNPMLQPNSSARKQVLSNGYEIAEEGEIFILMSDE